MLLYKENQIRSSNEQEQVHIYILQLTEHCFMFVFLKSQTTLFVCKVLQWVNWLFTTHTIAEKYMQIDASVVVYHTWSCIV